MVADMKYLGLGLLMLLACFMCLIFLAPGEDITLYDSVTLYNTRSNIVRGNTITLRNVSVDTGSLYEITGVSFRVAGATADMGVFPMEVEAGDSVIITSPYMRRFSGGPHGGIDFCVAGKPGSWIIATRDGLVSRVYAGCGKTSRGRTCNGPHTESFGITRCSGFGNYVVITHSDGTKTLYSHLAPGSVLVEPGQVVHTAQRLGIEGTSGSSDGVHLHYTIYGAKHTSSIANFDDVYANAIGGDQSAKEVLFTVGGIHTSYSSDRNSLNADTELANVYMSTRLLYETVIRDAETSDPLEIRDWGINARGRNNYIAILCVGGENSLEGNYTNSNVWRPLG